MLQQVINIINTTQCSHVGILNSALSKTAIH